MLTRRKQEFISHYITTKNATKSAELSGYSARTAYSQGSRLLSNVEVKNEIDKQSKAICAELEITKERIMENLWKDALSAQRPADRIAANMALARIRGDIRDQTTTNVGIFGLTPKDVDSLPSVTPTTPSISSNTA